MTRRVVLEICDADLVGILNAAVESGYIDYWAEFKKNSYDCDKGTITLREHNDEDDPKKRGPWKRVTIDTIARGLRLCSKMPDDEGGWAFTTWLKDRTGDAATADNIVQFGVLGELKYG